MTRVDTNILIYVFDERDLRKRAIARRLFGEFRDQRVEVVLLWQVLAEFLRFLRSAEQRGYLGQTAWTRHVRLVRRWFPLILPTPAVIDRALELGERYSLSHWDSMLLGACIEGGVDTLYTEDMGAPIVIGGVRLVNPFS